MNIELNNNRKKVFICLVVFVCIILGMSILLKKNNLKNKSSAEGVNSAISKSKLVKILKDKNGNVYVEENKLFKKYTINVPSFVNNISYKKKDNYLIVDFGEYGLFKLNSNSDKSTSKDILLTKKDTKYNLVVKQIYENNNFVYINNERENNKVIILISKVKKPFMHKVVLNPGHGGIDPGQIASNIREKDITLKIVKLMESDLEYKGIDVILTRNKDESQALNDIAAFVNKNHPDVFMSVHINGMEDNPNSYQGIGAYYYDENGFQRNERIKLANLVLSYTTHIDGWKNDGIVRDNLRVLRLSKYPCVLVETGYLTNDSDRTRLLNDGILENLANNLSNAIAAYLNKK